MESYLRQIEELRLDDEQFFASVLPQKFTSTTARTAPYLAYLAAQTAGGTQPPSTAAARPRAAISTPPKAEAYQILPKAYLERCGFKTRETYGQVANLTYITREVRGIVRRGSLRPITGKTFLRKTACSAEEIAVRPWRPTTFRRTIFQADASTVCSQILA